MAEPNVEKRKQLSMDFQRNVVKAGGQGLITTFISFNNTLTWNTSSGRIRDVRYVAPGQSGVARPKDPTFSAGPAEAAAGGLTNHRGGKNERGRATSRPLSHVCPRWCGSTRWV